jgi:hypothetical protein
MKIALDSQCVSYILSAMAGGSKPTGALAAEKIALFRTYLYLRDTFYISPTVIEECNMMNDTANKNNHEDIIKTLFFETYTDDITEIETLINTCLSYHSKEMDCRILAEAEVAGINVLLTYDFRFLKNLTVHPLQVRLEKPSTFWKKLSIPRGAIPNKTPRPTNPLAKNTWWKW